MREAALRVFVSHTREFRDHPASGSYVRAVESAISAQGWAITDMAYFAARDQRPAEYCAEQVRGADVYVGVIGLRYGTPVRDRPDVSYTEWEYEVAGRAGLPRLMFLLDEQREARLPVHALRDPEHGERQERFRARIRDDDLTVAEFATPDELNALVARALAAVERRSDQPRRRAPLLMLPPRTHTVVARPALLDAIVGRLLGERGGGPAFTAVVGTGGIGKTTLAGEVARDPRVQDRHPHGVLWVTLGQAVHGPDLTAKINDLSEQLTGRRPTFNDPEQAGFYLGGILPDGSLLVVDDVWNLAQLRPFLAGGAGCSRLLTTRLRTAVPQTATLVEVDTMSGAEAGELLGAGLGDHAATRPVLDGVLAATGNWPVLLRMAGSAVAHKLDQGMTATAALEQVQHELTDSGHAALDVTNPAERDAAVAATIESSLALLGADAERFLELAVFPEDHDLPRRTLVRLWGHTGGLTAAGVDRLCRRLDALALADHRREVEPRLRLHDVVGHYLRRRTADRLAVLHAALLDAHRGSGPWWELPDDEPYLVQNLARHLSCAGAPERDAVITDLRWIARRILRSGPEEVEADLAWCADPLAAVLATAIRQNTHMLRPITPQHSLVATLLYHLTAYPELWPLLETFPPPAGPHLVLVAGPVPERPPPALRRSWASGAAGGTVVVSPDGTWLATAGGEEPARIWNLDGSVRTTLDESWWALAAAAGPAGSWLATAGHDGVRFWNVDGTQRDSAFRPAGGVTAMAAGSGGSVLVESSGYPHTVTLHTVDGEAVPIPDPAVRFSRGMAVSPDGTWVATGGRDATVRLWNADGGVRATLAGHDGPVRAVAISPDGSWLASTGDDGTTRVWAAASGGCRAILPVGGTDVEIGPDGRWLAVRTDDEVQLWDAGEYVRHGVLPVRAHDIAAGPGKDRLTTIDAAGVVQLWSTEGDALPSSPEPPARIPLPARIGSFSRLIEKDPDELTEEDGPVTMGAFGSSAGLPFAMATSDGTIRVHSYPEDCALRLGTPLDAIWWTPDRRLAAVREQTAQIFELRGVAGP